MSELIEVVFASRRRINKREREELRDLALQPSNLRRIWNRIARLLDGEKSADGHTLEDVFLFGMEVQDIVRRPLMPLAVRAMSKPVVAFVYGFEREPFDLVFANDASKKARARLKDADPSPLEIRQPVTRLDMVEAKQDQIAEVGMDAG